MRNRRLTILMALLGLIIFTTACSSGISSATPAPTTNLGGAMPASTTALDGATLVQQRCTVCHPITFVEKSRHTAADWQLIVGMMISRGAQLTPDEKTIVVNYLSANFGQ
jgi:hypothetical protein